MDRSRLLLWSLGTVIAAAVIAWLTVRLTAPSAEPDESHSEASFHQWLHDNLEITAEQEKILHPHEIAFEEERTRQRETIEAAGADLAEAIRNSGDAEAPEVEAARRKLVEAQGELQRLTLDHFFAMKEHLSPEQGEKLLRWTQESIVDGHRR